MNISTSELLEAVRTATGAHVNPDDAFTVTELSEALGNSRDLTCKKIGRLQREGLVEVVKVKRSRIDGLETLVPAYRFLAKKAKR
jgi:hypothetical protein